MSSLFGGQVDPKVVSPVVGTGTQDQFFQALFDTGLTQSPDGRNKFAPMAPYPGPLSPDVNQTNLPKVWNAWQPWNAGASYMAGQLPNYQGAPGTLAQDPRLSNIMQYGGQGGPGTNAMANTVAYGSPSSDIGTWMHNLAQYGAAGPAGTPLNSIAQGYATGPAAYLQPFLAQNTPWYKPPAIQPTTVSRTQ